MGNIKNKNCQIKKYILGLDEVGRGALAGPVAVAAVALPANFRNLNLKVGNKKIGKIFDSKKLSAKKRQLWSQWLKNQSDIYYSISYVSPKVIDKINVSAACNLAAYRCYVKILNRHHLNFKNIVLDGSLYLKNKSYSSKIAQTIIRADEKFNAVKAASIIAKVSRDKLIKKLAKRYPNYGLEIHKGYGTKLHIQNLKIYGLSNIHRFTFCRNFVEN